MALKNTSLSITFEAWDVSGSQAIRKTGDAANIACTVSKDGCNFVSATNAPAEIQATGVYKLVLTASERNADSVTVLPTSSTSGVICNSVIDFPESNNSGVGINDVTLTVNDDTAHAIPGTVIVVRNSGDTITLATGTTDTNGQKVIHLDNGTYIVRLQKAGYNFSATETFSVNGISIPPFVGTALPVTAPTQGVQTIEGYAALSDGQSATGCTVEVRLGAVPQAVDGVSLSNQVLSYIVGSDRKFTLKIVNGATVEVVQKTFDGSVFDRKSFTVSDTPTAQYSGY